MRKIILFIFLFFFFTTPVFASPNIIIQNIPSSVIAGQEFEVSFNVSNLDINSTYKIKSLGGDSFIQVDTWNSSWLQQNASWSSMPEFTSNSEGSASATVKSRFDLDTLSGTKDFKIRIRKFDVDPNYDSLISNISVVAVTSSPSPSPSPTVSPTSTPTRSPSPSPTSTPIKTIVPTIASTKKSTSTPLSSPESDSQSTLDSSPITNQVLGSATEEPKVEGEKSKIPIVSFILIGSGIVLIAFAVIQFIRAAKQNIPQS